MRALLVGDVHSTPEDLDDCKRLMDFVIRTARAEEAEMVVLLGDIYNSHNVMRVEVLAFWRESFKRMRAAGLVVFVLVGNHDYAGEGLPIHALLAHEDQVEVVSEALELCPGVVCVPYMSDRQAFVELTQTLGREGYDTLLCHQTFQGSKYENGFYASDGVEPNLLPQKYVISGHIHTPQAFDKVVYIGAPRWRTLSDANIDRAIWLYEFGPHGEIERERPFDTGEVCRQIRYLVDSPEDPVQILLDPKHDWRIDIKGPSDWIEARKAELAGPGVKLRTFKTDVTAPRLKESEGVDVAFRKFLDGYVPRFGTDRARLKELANERLG